MITKVYCPVCGAEIKAGQEQCLSCGEYLWDVQAKEKDNG